MLAIFHTSSEDTGAMPLNNTLTPDRDVRSAVGIITEARNKFAHPGTEDLTAGYALARLHEIADILGQINAPEQKQAVQTIRDKLLTSIAPTPEDATETPTQKDERPHPLARSHTAEHRCH